MSIKPWFADSIEKTGLTRIGKSWSSEEENKLLTELQENKSFEDISKSHERTVCGIKCRINKIACKLHEQEKTIEEIGIICKLSEEDVIKQISKIKKIDGEINITILRKFLRSYEFFFNFI